ncbi:MAG TPA: homoserine dehydrogenase [Phycisphaerae bacterium]|nr:homoserine dehydrogenase [Phycisphaerae bacterium]
MPTSRPQSSRPATGVAIVGCGIIGSAVADALLHETALLRQRSGISLALRHVVDRDLDKIRRAGVPATLATADFDAALKNKDTHIVVELIGGLEPARTFVLKALKAGKHVVTANKYLLAVHGAEILNAAKRNRVCVQFEASCGGAIPIIAALTRSLLANDISKVVGIVNGTCNYILTQMTQSGQSYADALAGAQAAGFAERDPTFDVNGTDSAHKLAILSSLAFGAQIPFDQIDRTGIDTLSDIDLKFAREFGYVCKLLAIGEKIQSPGGGGLSLRVHPTFVANDQLLANVHGSFNAISVHGHAAGQTLYFGRGAGGKPTSSAVLSDILDIALGTAPLLFEKLPLLTRKRRLPFIPTSQIISRNYLRVTALDVPGVMAQITNILSKHKISLAGINQHESKAGQPVPIIITTHEARDGDILKALAEIDQLDAITANTIRIRVLA